MENSNPTQIKVSDVLEMLNQGKERSEIAAHYGLNGSELKQLFQHPQLKGKKTKKVKVPTFVIVDDVTEGVDAPVADTVDNTDAEASHEGLENENDGEGNDDVDVTPEGENEVEPQNETASAWDTPA